jgi:5-methylcytosine-specific restriction endonuclease McrA
MAWFKVDEHMSSHPAVWKAGDSALGLWLRMGCWLANFPKQGDFIPAHMAKHYGTKAQIRRLVEARPSRSYTAACVECGATSELSLDHIYPHSLGGEDTIENLRTLCKPCNSRKGASV